MPLLSITRPIFHAVNDEPHPQVDVAFGFLMTNCDPSMLSW